MTDKPEDLQSRLLQAFGSVSALLEHENTLLKTGQWQDVEKLLPRKRELMDVLRKLLPPGQTKPLTAEQRSAKVEPDMEAAAKQFNALVRANEELLQSAIAAQGTLIKLVLDDAAQEQRTGYGASGGYTLDPHAGALALRSDV
ncbi:hypothetical protein GOB86_05475 [Acetobacter lambici]|uniref:Flagellar biosynthesis protein FlgN n=1 Tax=Acetobacter lambici TaxID=1332824 RepID=A0ABT1EXZ0_9PROT|nr:hypothetical protein [Acetobacter lambici]MCP1241688.1 hypothetical protein [Acetobacter lambici]MCP1257813.1 hypothetical protein [Acetobacter lambici]NHO56523.1 hypothetical protein [Acetobacter lambici]